MKKIAIILRTKRASIYTFDLLFATLMLLILFVPLFSIISSNSIDSMANAHQSKKLSSLLQVSEEYYCNLAAQKSHADFSMDTYSYCGKLSDSFTVVNLADYSNIGLNEFSVHFSQPDILNDNQFCVQRQMLDSNSKVVSLWFCAY